MAYRIAIVDDRPQNLTSLSEKIVFSGEVNVLFTAQNGSEFMEKLKELAPDRLPQVVLMDIDMPVMNGIDTVRNSHAIYDNIRFIMLTVFDDDDKLFEAIQAGADGYLLKEERVDVILDSIREVVDQEGAPMSPRIARKALKLLTASAPPVAQEEKATSSLSDREMDILKELVNGLEYKQIAEKLFISPHTVRKHIYNIYEKLHVTSKTQVVKLALKNKWV
ncbi:response regulator transcription factor [soil metagenome]